MTLTEVNMPAAALSFGLEAVPQARVGAVGSDLPAFAGPASSSGRKLFVRSLPFAFQSADVRAALEAAGVDGIENVEVLLAPGGARSRGCGFVLFRQPDHARHALSLLASGAVASGGRTLAADWAEPRSAAYERAAQSVRAVHVSGLPAGTTEADLTALLAPFGAIERVSLPNGPRADFAFVHFAERSSAVAAVEAHARDPARVRECAVQVRLAKPDRGLLVRTGARLAPGPGGRGGARGAPGSFGPLGGSGGARGSGGASPVGSALGSPAHSGGPGRGYGSPLYGAYGAPGRGMGGHRTTQRYAPY